MKTEVSVENFRYEIIFSVVIKSYTKLYFLNILNGGTRC